jgi:hypothetical protein
MAICLVSHVASALAMDKFICPELADTDGSTPFGALHRETRPPHLLVRGFSRGKKKCGPVFFASH